MSETKRKAVDWPAVECDYRAGIMSLREMAARHKVSHVSIKKHADKHRWTRDLAAKIHARAQDLANREEATRSANAGKDITELETIEANARAILEVKLSHRGVSLVAVAAGRSMLAELLATCEDTDLRVELAQAAGDDDKLRKAVDRVLSLGSRIQSYRGIVDGLQRAVAIQRQAFDLDVARASAPGTTLEERLSEAGIG